jgi:hypothetical protein
MSSPWKPARVNIDNHVEFDTRYYSAVEVRATANVVEVSHCGRRVASDARRYDRQRFITVLEHMPRRAPRTSGMDAMPA